MNLFWYHKSDSVLKLPERVLLIHPFGIGDALFITPVIRTLKEHGVKQIGLLLGSRTRALFENNPHINQIFEWDKSPVANMTQKWKRWRELGGLFVKLWKSNYQVVLDFSPTAQYAFVSWLFFWIPVRVGFNFKKRGFFLTHKVELSNGYVGKSVAEYYLGLIQFFRIEPVSKKTEFFLSDEDRTAAQAIFKKYNFTGGKSFLAVVPGGGESWGKDARLKRWPVKHFGKLIQGLHQNYQDTFEGVFILGGQNEHFLGTELLQEFSGIPAYNLCGSTPIQVAAALIEKASLVVANDGGLVHIAHAVGTPVIGIYGPVDPTVYGPYPPNLKVLTISNQGPACRPCYQRFRYQADCKGVECLTHLAVNNVLDRIKSTHFFDQLEVTSALK